MQEDGFGKDKSYLNILVLSDRFVAKKMEVDGISAVSFFLWQHFRIMYCSSILLVLLPSVNIRVRSLIRHGATFFLSNQCCDR